MRIKNRWKHGRIWLTIWIGEILALGFVYLLAYFSRPAYSWGVAGAAARVGASQHLNPLLQRIDVLVRCQGRPFEIFVR